MDEKRPKSSITDLFNVYINIKNNEYLEKISNIKTSIHSTELLIKEKEDEKNNILNRNYEILENISLNNAKIAFNTNSIAETSKNIDKKLKNIDSNLKKQLDIQNQLLDLQKKQIIISENQSLQNEQQINLQKLSLIELEIQSQIALKNQIESDKQKQLKEIVFRLNEDLVKIKSKKDRIVQYILLLILKKNIDIHNFNADDLIELNDKQTASETLKKIDNVFTIINENFSKEDLDIIKEINDYPESYRILYDSIKEIEKTIKEKELNLQKGIRDIDNYKKSIDFIENDNRILQEKIKSINDGTYSAPNFKKPVIIFSLSFIFFLISMIRLFFIKNTENTEALIWFAIMLITFIIFLITLVISIKAYNNLPERVMKKSNKKLIRNSEINYHLKIENANKSILLDEKDLVNLKGKLAEKKTELSDLIMNYEGILIKYPEIMDVLSSNQDSRINV